MPTISFRTFGCKLNQAETEELMNKFGSSGWRLNSSIKSDVLVVNACAVTQKAEGEVRQLIHQINRYSPKTRLVVVGCFSKETVLREKNKVTLWLDNKQKDEAEKIISNLFERAAKSSFKKGEIGNKTRAFVKIQDGCRHFCSYCLVPYLRKKCYNKPLNQIIKEIKEKYRQGIQEVVLVGVNISEYGCRISSMKNSFQAGHSDADCQAKIKGDLVFLLRQILKQTAIPRIRLSSFWPSAINSNLLKLFKTEPRICPCVHLSIQSASDKILRLMGRGYRQDELKKIIEKLRRIPDMNLTADIIVGFPGEEKADFKKTCEFVKWADFLKIHVFRFSLRPGVKAGILKGVVSDKVKKERSRVLIEMGRRASEKIRQKYLGRTLPVLIESKKNFYWSGFSPNYLRVFVKSRSNLSNRIISVKLTELYKEGMKGEMVKGQEN